LCAGPVDDNGTSLFFCWFFLDIALVVIIWPKPFELRAGNAVAFFVEVMPIPAIR
jgi:hypothetical protein